MFEALFILTTVDSGTRVGRFLLQEAGGRMWKPWGDTNWLPSALGSTAVMVLGWGYFIWTGNISTIWPLFGVANQLLASVALAVGTTIIINMGRQKYAWVTLMPLLFLATSTITAGYMSIRDNFWPLTYSPDPALRIQGYVDAICTAIMLICAVVILVSAVRRWILVLSGKMPQQVALAEA
jgi:carbon starvation protein